MNDLILELSRLNNVERQKLVEYLTCPVNSTQENFQEFKFDKLLESYFENYPNVEVNTLHDEYVYVVIKKGSKEVRLTYQSDCNECANLINVIAEILDEIHDR